MQRAIVIDSKKNPLMPCLPARARELLRKGKAAVFRCNPFTIILLDRIGGDTQDVELKVDPGSKTTGIAVVIEAERGKKVVHAAEIEHRGHEIKEALDSRRANRRARRHRKTRYRQPRFDNRKRSAGWLPPSLNSRVDNVVSYAKRLQRLIPLSQIHVETVRFDMQKMDKPEIKGVEYQQGSLEGYEVREYLLEKWQRTCAYCGAQNVPLEVEHIIPKSNGGTNRVSNLTIACRNCNQKKGSNPIEIFLAKKPKILDKISKIVKQPLKDAAAVNATRYKIGDELKTLGLPVSFWSGGRTKHNRVKQNYSKEHWIDAACVGMTGEKVHIPKNTQPLGLKAQGRGSRQMCRVDRYGFPRTAAKAFKTVKGFKTGDIVKAVVTNGKKIGTYIGRVAIRASGNFNIKVLKETAQGISYKYCTKLHSADGYHYYFGGSASPSR